MAVDATVEALIEFERVKENQAWARWLARLIDRLLVIPLSFVFFFALGSAVSLGRLPVEFIAWADDPLLAVVGEIAVILALSALWEPLFLSNTGTTPGKWIMGVTVKREDGGNISLPTAYARFFWVYTMGLGLGIPFLSLICMLISRAKLVGDGVTDWDRNLKVAVSHKKRHPLVWGVALVVVVGTNIALGVLSRMS